MVQHHDLFACNAVNGLDGEVIKEIFISMMAMVKTGIKKWDNVEYNSINRYVPPGQNKNY